MEIKKYQSPFPGRPISGNDFNELADHVNQTLEEIVLTNNRLTDASDKLENLDKTTISNLEEFRADLLNAKKSLNDILVDVRTVSGRIEESSTRLGELDRSTLVNIEGFRSDLLVAKSALADIEKRQKKLTNKLRNFYSRQIELFGIFIAIFSFIIAGIQIAVKFEGSFEAILLKSTAIFIPIVATIVILMIAIRLAFK
jgi:hypothetical protein